MYRSATQRVSRRLGIASVIVVGSIFSAALANAAVHHGAKSAHTVRPTRATHHHLGANSPAPVIANTSKIDGTVTAIDASSLTVTTEGGSSSTFTIDSATTFTADGAAATWSDVAVGRLVDIWVAADGTTATRVAIEQSEQRGPQGPPPSGTHGEAVGVVTAINATSLTLTNVSGTATTFAIDTQTVFEKNHHAATSSDVTTGLLARVEASTTDPSVAAKVEVSTPRVDGFVSAVSGDSFTLNTPRGNVTVNTDGSTTITTHGVATTFASITVGVFALVEGTPSSDGYTVAATAVSLFSAPPGHDGDHGPHFFGGDHGDGPHGFGGAPFRDHGDLRH